MKVILRHDMPNLGKIGDMVTVKDGYARNYLIPRELALFATKNAERAIQIEKRKHLKKLEKEKEIADALALKLSELQISIAMKVGEEGKLYGSVSPQMVAQELSLRGFDIDKRNIIIEDAIKTLGVFDIKIKLHPEVVNNLKIWVISED